MHAVGVRGVTCNMCAGTIPTDTTLCDRWSQLAFLMPYFVMTTDTEPQIMTGSDDAGAIVKSNLEVRQKFRYYLESAYREARENNLPFVYPISMRYNDYMDDAFYNYNGVMIGDTLFYVAVLQEPSDGSMPITSRWAVIAKMPKGNWVSADGEYIDGEEQHIIGRTLNETSLESLLFFKEGKIFVLADSENEGHVIVRAYQKKVALERPIDTTFKYYENGSTTPHEVFIQLTSSGGAGAISFTYTSNGQSIITDIKVSRIEILMWDAEEMAGEEDWMEYTSRDDIDGKWDLEYDFIEREVLDSTQVPNSLFEDWVQDVNSSGSGDGGN